MAGYDEAFYKMAEMLGVKGPRSMSPADVFHNEIMPALEAALADAERYRWVTENADVDCRGHEMGREYGSLDECIDAAMQQEHK